MRALVMVVMSLISLSQAPPLVAQRLISIGLGGGVSIPQGDLSDGSNTGWHALGSLMMSTPMQPLGLRAVIAYNRFGFDTKTQAALGGNGYANVASGTLNATYRIPTPGTPISPYIIAGLGAYRTDCSLGPDCNAATHFGWNVGLGSRLYVLGFRSFVEARYHLTERNERGINYFPLTFGLMF